MAKTPEVYSKAFTIPFALALGTIFLAGLDAKIKNHTSNTNNYSDSTAIINNYGQAKVALDTVKYEEVNAQFVPEKQIKETEQNNIDTVAQTSAKLK